MTWTLQFASFRLDDIPALVPLQVAVEEVDHLGLVTTEDDVRQVYAMPTLQPEENSFVAQAPDGQIVGAAWVMVNQGDGETVFALNGHVHPAWRRQGIGQRLLDATSARARERLGEAAGRRAWLQSEEVHDEDAGRVALFERSGFHVARWAVDMRRELPGLGKIAPIIPIVQTVPASNCASGARAWTTKRSGGCWMRRSGIIGATRPSTWTTGCDMCAAAL